MSTLARILQPTFALTDIPAGETASTGAIFLGRAKCWSVEFVPDSADTDYDISVSNDGTNWYSLENGAMGNDIYLFERPTSTTVYLKVDITNNEVSDAANNTITVLVIGSSM